MEFQNIFKCVANTVDTIQDSILEELNLSFEEANNHGYKMATLSKSIKEHNGKTYCRLPFCHTVEAEALGSTVIFDEKVGNRIGKYGISQIDEMENISKIDLNKGRISKVLEAISILKREGERVILDVTGPISIVTSIMDSKLFYRTIRKDKNKAIKLLEVIEDSIIEFILGGIEQGADIISFADPTGTIDIVGPKMYEEIGGRSVYNIMKMIESKLNSSIIHLCGKTSTSLEYIGLLETEEIEVEGKNYFEMIDNIRKERKDITFIGHWCLKLDKKDNILINCRLK
ncbi:uroporphyrinogen decarboxylase family protein [Tissierella praeacuta]|uniref:uroporphyrinogen decarboxylase family protein n=1 Tax=Tissierella praeacuta TaxID=43131 RepID=UPI001C1048AF|nr:uroporphyrinogen decarboxylase family protein [Tissierella praeacuta]MBU5257337.1 uroporphyrinogen decarboxylase [Tissierella praeacuta]